MKKLFLPIMLLASNMNAGWLDSLKQKFNTYNFYHPLAKEIQAKRALQESKSRLVDNLHENSGLDFAIGVKLHEVDLIENKIKEKLNKINELNSNGLFWSPEIYDLEDDIRDKKRVLKMARSEIAFLQLRKKLRNEEISRENFVEQFGKLPDNYRIPAQELLYLRNKTDLERAQEERKKYFKDLLVDIGEQSFYY